MNNRLELREFDLIVCGLFFVFNRHLIKSKIFRVGRRF
jgi:hypothetical protein